jgi:hypothetical protein
MPTIDEHFDKYSKEYSGFSNVFISSCKDAFIKNYLYGLLSDIGVRNTDVGQLQKVIRELIELCIWIEENR